jgi:hypothetical protein
VSLVRFGPFGGFNGIEIRRIGEMGCLFRAESLSALSV